MQSNTTQKIIRSFLLSGLMVFMLSFLTTMTGWAQVYVNGNLRTGTQNASGSFIPGAGFFVSELQSPNTTIGSSPSYNLGFSIADDFTIPAGQSWNISDMEFYGYSTGYTSTNPFYDTLFIKIYNTDPTSATATPIWGDFTTNRLGTVVRDSTYRVTNTAPFNNRMIWRVKGTVNTTLAAGTYWIEWTLSSIASVSAHFSPPSTVLGTTTQPGNNAYMRTPDGWGPLLDGGTNQRQDMPFKIYYTTACSGPTPTVTISSSGQCAPATLTASGADFYTWTPATGLNTSTGATVTASPLANTTYTVTGVTSGGCSGTATVTVQAGATSAVLTPLEPGVNHVLESFSDGVPATWATQNRSNALGTAPTWGQGNPTLWEAFNGAPQTYLLSNFNVAGNGPGPDTISNWLFTPQITAINNGDKLTFYTRTVPNPGDPSNVFPDNLEVRLSTAGASVNVGTSAVSVGDFNTLLLAVNPDLDQTSYPHEWTKYEVTISGLSGTASGRIGFRHYVPDGGPNGEFSDNIGLDLIRFYTPTACAAPGSDQYFHVNVLGAPGPFTIVYTDGTNNTTVNNYVKDSLILVNPTSATTYGLVSAGGAGPCSTTNVSGSLVVNIGGAPTIVTQPAASTNTCENGTASINVSAPGNTYQWQVSTDGGITWTNVTNDANYNGATTQSLSLSNVPASWNTYMYQVIVTSTCGGGSITSTSSTLSVTAAPVVNTQPAAQSVCSGNDASFSISITGTTTYQWQVSADGGATWTDITGATSGSYTVTGTTVAQNGYQYRVVYASCGSPVFSDVALLTVNESTVISTQPSNVIACSGNPATFSVTASGASNTYQWQVSADGGATWTDIAGATSNGYTIPVTDITMNNNQYHVVITNPCGAPVVSNNVTLDITASPIINSHPADIAVCSGADATFTITITGSTTYQWQVSADGGATWTDIAGATSASYTVTGTTIGQNGNRYRVIIQGCDAPITSDSGILTVNESTAISAQPADAAVCDGSAASFSVTASGASNTYQWQTSTDGGVTWTDISGAISASYSIAAVNTTMANYQYRVVITNPCGAPVVSSAAVLTISAAAAIIAQPESITVCQSIAASFSVTATGATGYQWQVSTDGGASWTDIAGATSTSYSIANASSAENGNQYHVVVTGCGGATVTSSAATLTVTPSAVIDGQPTNQTVCIGGDAMFNVIMATGTSLTYQWQVSTDGGTTWTDITGANSDVLSLTGITASMNGNQYHVVINGDCTADLVSANATLTASSGPAITSQPADVSICDGDQGSFSVTASDANSYQWQVSNDGGNTWTDIADATNATLNADAVDRTSETMSVRVIVTNACGSVTSDAATFTVNPIPVVTISASATTIAPGETVTITATSVPAGATYEWYFNGEPSTGLNTQTITVSEAGVYSVEVFTAAGCSAMSDDVTIAAVSVNFAFITPNPNNGTFKVNYHNSGSTVANRVVTIYDATGRLVFRQNYIASMAGDIEVINMSVPYLHPGVYWLMLSEANGKRLEVGQFFKR